MDKLQKNLTSIIVIILVAIPLKLHGIFMGLFAFAYDQGRDFVEVAKILNGNLTLIGPTTGIQGIFYGPWWYYFLTPLIFVTKGDPKIVAIFFGLLSIFTIICLCLLVQKITKNSLFALLISLIALTSASDVAPNTIWSPTLTPLLIIIYFYTILKIIEKPTKKLFFFLGLVAMLISDTSGSFTAFIIPYTLILVPLVFRKIFLKKELIFTFIGILLVASPRILFEFRNKFLMTSTLISFLKNPEIKGSQMELLERLLARINDYLSIFADLFTRQEKAYSLGAVFLLVILTSVILVKRKYAQILYNDYFSKFSTFFLLSTFMYFVLYPDTVWRYYLVFLPILYLIVIAALLNNINKIVQTKLVLLLLVILLIFNIRLNNFKFDNSWQGSGADYVNQVRVLDYISSKNPSNYRINFYTSSLIDYPFNYLYGWYVSTGKIKISDQNIKYSYLVIRNEPTDGDYKKYWYSTETKQSAGTLEKKTFPGDITLEIHELKEE